VSFIFRIVIFVDTLSTHLLFILEVNSIFFKINLDYWITIT